MPSKSAELSQKRKLCFPLSPPFLPHQSLTQEELHFDGSSEKGGGAPPAASLNMRSSRRFLPECQSQAAEMCRSFNCNTLNSTPKKKKGGKLLNPGGDRLVNVHFLLINTDTQRGEKKNCYSFTMCTHTCKIQIHDERRHHHQQTRVTGQQPRHE